MTSLRVGIAIVAAVCVCTSASIAQTPSTPPKKTQAPAGTQPAVPKPNIIKAEEALDANQTKEAVAFAVEAVKEEPESGHAWFTLGIRLVVLP